MYKILVGISVILFSNLVLASFKLPQSVYSKVPFSAQYSGDGALIRNINYSAVQTLIPQIEKRYGLKLESRGEAHITVISPPEAQGWFSPDKRGINHVVSNFEILSRYAPTMQDTSFEIECVGAQKDNQGNLVFFLVVSSSDLEWIRKDIQSEVERRNRLANKVSYFDADDYYAHITIGYVGADVHGVSKGRDTCFDGIEYTQN